MVDRILYIVVGVSFMLFVYQKVKKKILEEKESIFWMVGALGILILGIFPGVLTVLADLFNIKYAPSLLFFVGIMFLLGLIFRLSTYVSVLKEQTKELAQVTAILNRRIEELEKKRNKIEV